MKKLIMLMMAILPLLAGAAVLDINISLVDRGTYLSTQDYATKGWGTISDAGSLQLPVKTINILMPKGAQILSWNLKLAADMPIMGEAPQRNAGFTDGDITLHTEAAKSLGSRYKYLGMKHWGELCYASFAVIPAVWDGAMWMASPSCDVEIAYQATPKGKGTKPATLAAQDFFANAAALDKWYESPKDRNANIMVISTQGLYDAMSPWVAFRQSQGCTVTFFNVTDAINMGTGVNSAARLRNFLQCYYQSTPFEYLLLVGDHNTVPVAYLSPEPNGANEVPSDFFFGDLSSNWDSDNDGRFGEYSSGYMDQDWEIDFTPEVYVGRISTNVASQVAAIAERIVAFEQSNAPWKNANLLPAAFLNYLGEPEAIMPQTDGAGFMEFERLTSLAGMNNTTMYEQLGVVLSYPSNVALSYSNFRDQLLNNSWGFINWSAHGSATSSSRKVWMSDDNQNNLPDSWEMQWLDLVDKPSFDDLSNTDGTVIFAASCNNGMIDATNTCLAEYALIKKAVGVLGATRTGWYKVGWRNPGWGGLSSYNHHFVENYRQSGLSLGASHAYANLLHTQYYLFGDPIDSGGIIYPELQNVYTYLLYGDPLIGYTPQQQVNLGEILVWEPDSLNCLPVVNALRSVTGMNVIYTDKLIPDYDYLDNFEAVFCSFRSTVLDSLSYEYQYLNDYLDNGGKLYVEGGSLWFSNPNSLLNKIGAYSPYSGVTHINSIRHAATGNIWQYNAPQEYATMLAPLVPTATDVFINNTGEAYEPKLGIWNSNGSFRTLASSFYLYNVADSTFTLEDMIAVICDTLDIGIGEPVSNNEEVNPPAAIELHAYPNPGQSMVNVKYNSPQSGAASLEVYNLKGQKVRTLFKGYKDGGEQHLSWDLKDDKGRPCANGLYFFRLQTPGRTSLQKQVILR